MSQLAANTDNSASARPFELNALFRRVTELPGIGPKIAGLLARLCKGERIADLLWHLPIDIVDRRHAPNINEIEAGHIVTLELIVGKHTPSPRKSLPYRVRCSDETGTIDLVFFRARKDWLLKQLPPGSTVIVSGKVDIYRGHPQIVHPDTIGSEEDKEDIQKIEPVYPLTAGITNKIVCKSVKHALNFLPSLPEWLDESYKEKNKWPSWDEAIKAIHNPASYNDLEPDSPVRSRLAYDEFLANQLALALVRNHQRAKTGRSFKIKSDLKDQLIKNLPFELTGAQKRSIAEIDEDMSAPYTMLRMLQGDVGAGKTVIAALSMINAIASGAQACIMAPTEILARQHEESLRPLFEKLGIRIVTLTGRDKGKSKELLLQQIKNGAAQLVIGTHALFQDNVEFKDLGIAVIDEQHRFGVHQRLKLSSKGKGCDVLVMTATPIPRTLTLTAYGDMDVSRLDEKPPGRKPIDTRLFSTDNIHQLTDSLSRKIAEGARIYWVCPLVEESEVLDLAAAEERYEILQGRFGDKVGLVHGKMKAEEKDAVMAKFASGEIDILVATTVIEVGVNVPEATIMMIEHAERFGLAQLHQLRGRVGRGADKSYCFLIYGALSETAKERLSTMRDTEDGFIIAEKDLALRGAGEILGTRQSGMPEFKLGELPSHAELLAAARDDAKIIIQNDPKLKSSRGTALRNLLYLFEKEQAFKLIRSG
jgi:ATP-dependent DNA helicase RecG